MTNSVVELLGLGTIHFFNFSLISVPTKMFVGGRLTRSNDKFLEKGLLSIYPIVYWWTLPLLYVGRLYVRGVVYILSRLF